MRFSDIYDGKKLDASYDMGEWDHPSYDDRAWSRCLPRNRRVSIVGSVAPPVRRMEKLKVVNMYDIDPALWVREPNVPDPARLTIVDFGQNAVGRIKLRIRLDKGKSITIRHGEISSGWKRDGARMTFEVQIPANVTALLRLPGMGEKVIGSGKYTFKLDL